jgi:fermentation-respiration switch protein FrsA (DUF1100 family)
MILNPLKALESRLTFKPNAIDHGGLTDMRFERFRLGSEFGLDLDAGFVDNGSSLAVLFLHGNRHNVTRFGDHYRMFNALGWSYLFFDYPGYGKSSGYPTEAGVYAAARAAYSHLRYRRGFAPENILVYGASMGGAVSMELLLNVEARALVTESTFTCTWAMAQYLYPALPVWRFLPNRFRNNERLPLIRIPKLLIHGDKDRVVPVSMAHTLFSLAQDPKRLLIIEGSNHVDCLARGTTQVSAALKDLVG